MSPIPKAFRLLQNYPNPFNPAIWIPYELAANTPVTICIYDVKGQFIRQLELGKQEAGSYLDKKKAAYWDGKSQLGQSVSSGLYFYTLRAGIFQATRKMVIQK
jgi:flagellar hook assembly protein FlgD